jgi:arylsulfatase A-like enzyme
MRQTAGYPPLTLIRQNTVIREVTDDQQQFLEGWYTDEATQFIKRARAQGHAFFLVLSQTKVHTPLHPLPLFLAKAGGNVYRAEVEEVDDAVGNVLNVAGPETLVVFMSDNGGTVHGSNAPLRGFKGGYLEGGVRVPMIWHWPGHIPAGVVNSKIVSVMDLLPTLEHTTNFDGIRDS